MYQSPYDIAYQKYVQEGRLLQRSYSRQFRVQNVTPPSRTEENCADGYGMMERLERVKETLNLLKLRLELEKKQLAEEKREAMALMQRASTIPIVNTTPSPSCMLPALPQPPYAMDMRLSSPYEENLNCQLLQNKYGVAPSSVSFPPCHYAHAYFCNANVCRNYNNLQSDRYSLAYYSCRNLAAAAAYREHLDRVDKMCHQEILQMQTSMGCLKQVKKIVDQYSGGAESPSSCQPSKPEQRSQQQSRRADKNLYTNAYYNSNAGSRKRGDTYEEGAQHGDTRDCCAEGGGTGGYDHYGCRIASSNASISSLSDGS